jgi:hypothetical protein
MSEADNGPHFQFIQNYIILCLMSKEYIPAGDPLAILEEGIRDQIKIN